MCTVKFHSSYYIECERASKKTSSFVETLLQHASMLIAIFYLLCRFIAFNFGMACHSHKNSICILCIYFASGVQSVRWKFLRRIHKKSKQISYNFHSLLHCQKFSLLHFTSAFWSDSFDFSNLRWMKYHLDAVLLLHLVKMMN